MEMEALPDAAAVEQATQQQQQQETHSMDQETIPTAHTQKHDHSSPTDEDYGPLKKKHKYRDDRERDKEGRATMIAGGDQGGNPAELDGSVELHDPSSAAPAVSVEPSYNIEQQQQPEQARDHSPRTEERPTAAQAAPEEQQQEAQQSRNEEHSKSKDLASSPSSNTEKARKHNFYVPSREVAFLLDSFPTTVESSGDASSSSSTLQNQNMTSGTGDASGAGSDTTDPAQAQANALLASGMPISSRQAAKIAAMEAKEKARLEKEKELEELKLKRKAEAERKKAEAARKKAEKEAGIAANTASVQSTKRKDSTASNMSAQQAGAAAAAAVPAKAPSKPKRAPTAASKRGNTKSNTSTTTKQASPELPVYENLFQNSLPSPDIKITSPPQQHLSHAPQACQSSIPVPPSSNAQIILPPMPEPQVDPMSGFIPYASEGARAAALAKAAKQKANGAAGSPPSGSGNSTLPVPGTSANTKNNRGGKKNQAQGSPLGVQQLLGAAAATASTFGPGNKKGKQSSSSSNSALNGNGTAAKGKAQALAAAANAANSYSGRASPTNALEHAAAAIDAVLDAGALARAQAQAEEEEEDDRLYCICQQLYDPERLMIACDRCDNWFHADCINIDEDSITLIDLFICPVCEKGRSIML